MDKYEVMIKTDSIIMDSMINGCVGMVTFKTIRFYIEGLIVPTNHNITPCYVKDKIGHLITDFQGTIVKVSMFINLDFVKFWGVVWKSSVCL